MNAERRELSAIYEIRVRGELTHEVWSAWFDGMEVTPDQDGETLLTGEVRDQAALYGLIARLRDLALTLVSVRQIPAQQR